MSDHVVEPTAPAWVADAAGVVEEAAPAPLFERYAPLIRAENAPIPAPAVPASPSEAVAQVDGQPNGQLDELARLDEYEQRVTQQAQQQADGWFETWLEEVADQLGIDPHALAEVAGYAYDPAARAREAEARAREAEVEQLRARDAAWESGEQEARELAAGYAKELGADVDVDRALARARAVWPAFAARFGDSRENVAEVLKATVEDAATAADGHRRAFEQLEKEQALLGDFNIVQAYEVAQKMLPTIQREIEDPRAAADRALHEAAKLVSGREYAPAKSIDEAHAGGRITRYYADRIREEARGEQPAVSAPVARIEPWELREVERDEHGRFKGQSDDPWARFYSTSPRAAALRAEFLEGRR